MAKDMCLESLEQGCEGGSKHRHIPGSEERRRAIQER